VAGGTPEDIVKGERSRTGRFLREVLARRPMKRASAGTGRSRAQREAAE
jgi:excinuclease ABC subunit A